MIKAIESNFAFSTVKYFLILRKVRSLYDGLQQSSRICFLKVRFLSIFIPSNFPLFEFLISTLFRWDFWLLLTDGGGGGWAKSPPSLKSVTHMLQWRNLAQLYLTQRRSKNIWIMWQTSWVLLKSVFFHRKSANFALSRNTYIDCILLHDFYLF